MKSFLMKWGSSTHFTRNFWEIIQANQRNNHRVSTFSSSKLIRFNSPIPKNTLPRTKQLRLWQTWLTMTILLMNVIKWRWLQLKIAWNTLFNSIWLRILSRKSTRYWTTMPLFRQFWLTCCFHLTILSRKTLHSYKTLHFGRSSKTICLRNTETKILWLKCSEKMKTRWIMILTWA